MGQLPTHDPARWDDDALRAHVEGRQWYHTLEVRPGITTPGWFDLRETVDDVPLPRSLTGLRCLDVGTFDGFWAFTMEDRGADEVVAVDVPDPADWDWPPGSPQAARDAVAARHEGGAGFALLHAERGSGVVKQPCSVYDLSPEAVGTFDLVYVGSLLLHLRDPVAALGAVRSVCRGQMLLVDAIDGWLTLRFPRRPVAELDGRDRPWWWNPNQAALVRMVESAGFRLLRPAQRVRMPAGRGQGRPALRPRTLASRAARGELVRTRRGDLHAALLAAPDQ